MVRTLEYCSEQLPQPLSLQGEISEATSGLLVKKTRLCSQMNSVVDFHSHVYHMVSTGCCTSRGHFFEIIMTMIFIGEKQVFIAN